MGEMKQAVSAGWQWVCALLTWAGVLGITKSRCYAEQGQEGWGCPHHGQHGSLLCSPHPRPRHVVSTDLSKPSVSNNPQRKLHLCACPLPALMSGTLAGSQAVAFRKSDVKVLAWLPQSASPPPSANFRCLSPPVLYF